MALFYTYSCILFFLLYKQRYNIFKYLYIVHEINYLLLTGVNVRFVLVVGTFNILLKYKFMFLYW